MSDAPADATPAPAPNTAPEAAQPAAPTEHPDVKRLDNALERGDFHDAQRLARQLAASDDPTLRAAGEAALDRYRLDPTVLAVLAFTGLLILYLASHYLGPH